MNIVVQEVEAGLRSSAQGVSEETSKVGHYITLHYATLHYTTLCYTTLHYTNIATLATLATLHGTTLHYTTLETLHQN